MVDGRYHEYNHGEVVPGPLIQLQTHDHITIDNSNGVIEQLLQHQSGPWTTRVDEEDPTKVSISGTVLTLHGSPMEYIRMELLSREPLPMPPTAGIFSLDIPYGRFPTTPRPKYLGELMKKDGKNIDEIIQARSGLTEPYPHLRLQPNDRDGFKEYLVKCGWTKRASRRVWRQLIGIRLDPSDTLRQKYNDYFSKRETMNVNTLIAVGRYV